MGVFSEGADLMFTPGRCKKTAPGLGSHAWSNLRRSLGRNTGSGTARTLREMAQAKHELTPAKLEEPAAPLGRMAQAH